MENLEQEMKKHGKKSGLHVGWTRLLPWAIGGTVLASFLVLVCGSYYLHSTSDPVTWLNVGRNFAEEFGKSRWPYGYPLYLRGMLSVLGPYWIFLANLPALLGMFVVAGWIGTLFQGDDRRLQGENEGGGIPRSWGFLAVWVVIVGANSGELLRYVNPYRDPPSYLLLLALVGVFVQSLKSRRMWGVVAAGALLGLACSVREPSVLMLLPLFAYGLLAWWRGRPELGLWRTVGAFALGMGLGLLPMLVQSYLATKQVFVPHNLLLNVPESQEESKLVPGMYFTGSRLAIVTGKAYAYYLGTEKLLMVLAAVGFVAAVWRRNRLILSVVVPTAVGYAVFYSFYRMFVPRYFYVAVLFFALLASYGLLSLLRFLCAKIRPPRVGRAAGWVLLAAMAVTTSVRLLGERAKVHPHQVPQARAMTAAIRDICPDPSIVYVNRPLCEWIEWFLECESRPLLDKSLAMIAPGAAGTYPWRDSEATTALLPRLERGEKVYAAFCSKDAGPGFDVPYVRRLVDLLPVGSFDPQAYLYDGEGFANGIVRMYRLVAWTNLAVSLDWPVPERGDHGGAYWAMVDVGDWPEGHAPADITVDGTHDALPSIPHGGAWVGCAEAGTAEAGSTVAATIASTDPLPRAMAVRTGRIDEPLVLDFRLDSEFDHFWRWNGDIHRPSNLRENPGVAISSGADLDLPVPRPELAGAIVALELRSERKAPTPIPLSISENGHELARMDVAGDHAPIQLVVPLASAPDNDIRRLHFDVEAQPAPKGDTNQVPIGVECLRTTLYRWPVSFPVTIEIGTPDDSMHVLSGFNRPEGRGNAAYRWTQGTAEVAVYLPAHDEALVLSIEASVEGMPRGIRPKGDPELRVMWDGVDLSGHLILDGNGNEFVWKGLLPMGTGDGRTPHRLGLESPTWCPADFGIRDSRTLGVRIGRIDIAPGEILPAHNADGHD